MNCMLHVQFIGPEELAAIQPAFPKAYAAVKRVAMFHADAEWLRAYCRHQRHQQRFGPGLGLGPVAMFHAPTAVTSDTSRGQGRG